MIVTAEHTNDAMMIPPTAQMLNIGNASSTAEVFTRRKPLDWKKAKE